MFGMEFLGGGDLFDWLCEVRLQLRAESEKRYSRRDSFTHTPARRLTERDQRCTPVDSYYGKLFTYMLSISTHNLPFAY